MLVTLEELEVMQYSSITYHVGDVAMMMMICIEGQYSANKKSISVHTAYTYSFIYARSFIYNLCEEIGGNLLMLVLNFK